MTSTSTPWQWVDLFSEGGPFLLAEVNAFRAWPGSDGWDDAISELEAPGGLVPQEKDTLCFFDPEDPGPMQLGWTDDRIVLVRWTPGDGSPSIWRELDAAARAAFDARIRALIDEDLEEAAELGELTVSDGLLVVSWAALDGEDLGANRASLEALATSVPHEVRRNGDGGPALTAIRVKPGRYAVTGVFDFVDDEDEGGGTWIALTRR